MTPPVSPAPRFYVDEDLSNDLSPELRSSGYDAVHTREVGNGRQVDPRQLAYATRHGRVLLTANLGDFRMLHEAWVVWAAEPGVAPTSPHAGIVVLPNPNEMEAVTMARLLVEYVRAMAPADLASRLLRYRSVGTWEDLSAVRGPKVRPE